MPKTIKQLIWVGMDVHQKRISVYWLEGDTDEGHEESLLNTRKEIARLFRRLKKKGEVRACYEGGPCGYEVRRQLDEMDVSCAVIAPSLIPRSPGEKVKTDRKDARKLARLYRAGELTEIRVPTEREESVRDLVRCREDARQDVMRKRHRLSKFLLRRGRVWTRTRNWSQQHWVWLRKQTFEHPEAQRTFEEYVRQLDFHLERLRQLDRELEELAQQEPWRTMVDRLRCLKGLNTLSALMLVVEIVDFRRFKSPRELMSYLGLTPSLYASADTRRSGGITKTGNSAVRRILVESSWHYRHPPQHRSAIRRRTKGQADWVHEEAVKAQERLHRRYVQLRGRKRATVANAAVARELVGFVWALMVEPKDRIPKKQTQTFTLTGRVAGARKSAA